MYFVSYLTSLSKILNCSLGCRLSKFTSKCHALINKIDLSVVHKCQHFHESTNHPLSGVGGGGVCENQHFFLTLLTFWPDFYYFDGDFWNLKNVDVCSIFGEGVGGGLRKCMVFYTHENVDIYGWLLSLSYI